LVSISDSQQGPLPNARWLRTIHHGIECSNFQFYEKPGKYLAFLGRISAEKRPDWAIEIAKKAGVPLKIAAKIEGSEGREYFDRFVKPHLGRDIEYVGEISEREKSEFLGNALGLAFPIDWPEPFGLVVIESLVCGTPVLTRPVGSMPEINRDGITGFMHPDLNVLAKQVPHLAKVSRRGCRDWVEKRFSLKRMTEDYINVYRHLTEFRSHADRHRRHIVYPLQRSS
jgi:glycosyltransferase involved in cell wall biosynthesis